MFSPRILWAVLRCLVCVIENKNKYPPPGCLLNPYGDVTSVAYSAHSVTSLPLPTQPIACVTSVAYSVCSVGSLPQPTLRTVGYSGMAVRVDCLKACLERWKNERPL